MIKKYLKPLTVLLAVAGFSMNASAQDPNCDNITWNDAAAERLPTAADHCLDVVNRDGGWYAMMHARIMRQNDTNTMVSFKNRDGEWAHIERTHPDGITVEIDGAPVRIKDVLVGQEVNVYVSQVTYFSLPEPAPEPEPEPAPAPVAEPEPEPEPAPVMLPKTAGNANWLAVFGTLLVLLSSVLYVRRNS